MQGASREMAEVVRGPSALLAEIHWRMLAAPWRAKALELRGNRRRAGHRSAARCVPGPSRRSLSTAGAVGQSVCGLSR